MKKWAVILCLSAILGSSYAHAGDNASFDLAASPETQLDRYIEVESEEDGLLKNIKRVAITQFQVEFMTESSASAYASGGFSSPSSATEYVDAKLAGVGINEFQQITDRYYDTLVNDLKNAGIEVVDQAEVLKNPDFKEITSGGKKSPLEESAEAGKGVFVTSHDLPVWFNSEEGFIRKFKISIGKGKKDTDPYQSFGSKMGLMFSGKATAINEPALAKAFDAATLRVRVTVPFVQIKTDSTLTRASTHTKAVIQVEKKVTRLSFVTPDGKHARIRIKEPLVSATGVGELKDVTTSGEKAMQAATTVLSVANSLFGARGGVKVGSTSGKSYSLEANSQLYTETVNAHIDGAQKLMSEGLAKARK